MTGRSRTERILDAYLAPEADRLPDRVIEATLADIARTPQRRALRVPWRFRLMTNTMRVAAGIAIVAIVGVGALALNLRSPGSGTGPPASGTPAPTSSASPAATPAPSDVAPGISGWTTYRSAAYEIRFGYPVDWHVEAPATRRWQPGDSTQVGAPWVFADKLASPDGDDQIGMWVWQMAPGSGADIMTVEGLIAWAKANACDEAIDACATLADVALPMCAEVGCGPGVLVPLSDSTTAFLGGNIGPTDGLVTIVSLGRPDSFAGAAKYGGTVELLKSILSTMNVSTPKPGQTPSG